jgi:FAD/FMN-containing dehydrogenase
VSGRDGYLPVGAGIVAGVNAFDSLRVAIDGVVLAPSDDGYEDARHTFNATVSRHPEVIVQPRSRDGVVAAVRWARSHGLPVAVRGGGHGVAGHAVADGSLVVDLRHMRGVSVDVARRRARVQGGATWEDVDRATLAHELVMTGGTFQDTGVGGLTLGGGIGFLMGMCGLTCDNLVRAEVVTADGSIAIAGEGGDPELLWALRGGGGNFGVVTEFEFSLHPLPPVTSGDLSVPLDKAEDALAVLAEFAATAPREAFFFCGGPAAVEQENERAASERTSEMWISACYFGAPEHADAVLRPIRALPTTNDTVAPTTYLAVQQSSGTLPFGLRHYWKSTFLRDLDRPAAAAIVEGMRSASGASFVLVEAMTGQSLVEPAGGAAFGMRGARWNVSAIAAWQDPADDEAQIAWARRTTQSLQPWAFNGAGYANYASFDETADRVRTSFGEKRFARLQAVKRRYDPDNAFRFNLNVPAG